MCEIKLNTQYTLYILLILLYLTRINVLKDLLSCKTISVIIITIKLRHILRKRLWFICLRAYNVTFGDNCGV